MSAGKSNGIYVWMGRISSSQECINKCFAERKKSPLINGVDYGKKKSKIWKNACYCTQLGTGVVQPSKSFETCLFFGISALNLIPFSSFTSHSSILIYVTYFLCL